MKFYLYFFLIVGCFASPAQNAVVPSKTSDFQIRQGGNFSVKDGVFTVSNDPLSIRSKMVLPLSANQKCRLSGEFRTRPGGDDTKFGFGILFVDQNKKVLDPRDICVISGTRTALAEEMKAGSRSVLIENGAKWKLRNSVIAFMKSSDSSSAEYTSPGIAHIEQLKGTQLWQVYFSSPVRFACPKGKIIQQHLFADRCFYAVNGAVSNKEWKHFEITIDPDKLHGVQKTMRDAAAGATIFIHNSPAGSQADLEFKNIKLEEVF